MTFIAQSFSLTHATRYNDNSHEHNGIACETVLISAEDVAIIPSFDAAIEYPKTTEQTPKIAFISASYDTPQGRAPPPRSPPFLF